jgi:nuclear pore complex protein Nup88
MESLLSHCVRSDGEKLDPSLSPAPCLLCEDGRGMLYALGADGVVRAAPARHVNAAARGTSLNNNDNNDDDGGGDGEYGGDTGGNRSTPVAMALRASTRVFQPEPAIDFEPRTIAVSPSGHFACLGGLRHATGGGGSAPPSSALTLVSLRSAAGGINGGGGGGGGGGRGVSYPVLAMQLATCTRPNFACTLVKGARVCDGG